MKKRYFVSLDQEITDQFKADLESLNLPPATFSNLVNEWIESFAPSVHQMAEKKRKGEQLSFEEIMGTVLDGTARKMMKS